MDERNFRQYAGDVMPGDGPGDADDLEEEGFEEVEADELDTDGVQYKSEPDDLDLELEDQEYEEEIDDDGYDINELEEEESLYEDEFFEMDFDDDDVDA